MMVSAKRQKRRLGPAQRAATAYHEAGHAVVALHLGQKIGRKGAAIVPDAGFDGCVHIPILLTKTIETEPTDRMRLLAEKHAVMSLSGIEAQRRYRPSSVRNYHASQDYHNAADIIGYFCESPEELDAYLRLLHIRAKALIQSPAIWGSVERVAAALLERNRLTGADLRSLIHATT
jgi:hypothetical protein